MNSPKELWHPVLIVVDEAHLFAPERGQSEAMSAVIDLCTRGRKREFCGLLATQRISKLHKDAAAECLNKLIGRTGLDIDMKRAGDELGFTTREQTHSLRDLEPGEFFAFGPAISKSVQKVIVGEVCTPHGREARKGSSRKPAPTAKVKKVLERLVDLPKEAEEEIRDREALRVRVKELERELTQAKRVSQAETKVKTVSDPKAVERAIRETKAKAKAVMIKELKELTIKWSREISELQVVPFVPAIVDRPVTSATVRQPVTVSRIRPTDDDQLGQCERKILGFLSVRSGEFFTKVQVGAMTGYSHGSGGFNNAISKLSTAGMIQRNGSSIALNPLADVSHLIDQTPHKLEDWIRKLGQCERAVYERLLASPETTFRKDEIAEATGYSAGSGGFNNALSRLSTLGLLKRENGGSVRFNPEIIDAS